MADSSNQAVVSNEIKHIRRGVTLYKRGKSRFWYARVYDAKENLLRTKSTKTTYEYEAQGIAIEFANEVADSGAHKASRKHAISDLCQIASQEIIHGNSVPGSV